MKRELWYSVVVRDRHGKIVSRERRKSKSFLKAWNELVYVQTSNQTTSITDTGGVLQSVPAHANNFGMDADAGITTHGIRAGTGNTAVAIDDYALETPIEEGTGAGQMEHLICDVDTSIVSAPNCSFLCSRAIVNNSGGLITVREGGIYTRAGVGYYVCPVREVFGTPQDVPNGGSIVINWTLRVTV